MNESFYEQTLELVERTREIVNPFINNLGYGNLRGRASWSGTIDGVLEIKDFKFPILETPKIYFEPTEFYLGFAYEHDLLSSKVMDYSGTPKEFFLRVYKNQLTLEQVLKEIKETVASIPELRLRNLLNEVSKHYKKNVSFQKFIEDYSKNAERTVNQILTAGELKEALEFEAELKRNNQTMKMFKSVFDLFK